MKKNVMQDVVVQKKSIRDISIPKKRNSFESKLENLKSESYKKETEAPSSYNFEYNQDNYKNSKKGLYFSIFIFLIALVFGVSSLFTKATIRVVNKKQTLPLSINLSAKKDMPATEFGYQVVSITSSKDTPAEAVSEQKSEVKASGTIVIYNETNTIQKLVATTRFETKEGLIFRIKDTVSIPASKKVNGKNIAGSIEAVVYADKEGEMYNIAKTDFTLPGFKNSPNYKNIYARSKTDMAGGFSGVTKVLEESNKVEIENRLEKDLRESMRKEISAQIPSNFVMFENGIEYSFDDAIITGNGGSSVTVTKKGVASAIIFDKKNLTKEILSNQKDALSIQEADDISISDIEKLNFSLSTSTKSFKNLEEISFNLKGDITLVWNFDKVKLLDDLLGINKDKLNDLLRSKYPSIESADLKMFPFWKSSLPLNKEKIEIKI